MNKLILSSLLAVALISTADVATAGGKPNGSKCHVSKSCSSHVCVTLNPADKFGVCCTPQSCAAVGAQCGTAGDGCGLPIECGPCDSGSSCVANQCVPGTTTTTSTTSTTTSTSSTSTTSTTTSSTTTSSTTTSSTTSTTLLYCGDGIISAPEECDDGGISDGDGCDSFCNEESGFDCTGAPSTCSTTCGDGIIAGTEQCDDSNVVDGDGCSDTCQNQCINLGFSCSANADCCSNFCNSSHCQYPCFRGDTVVATAEGLRPIRDLKPGDQVWSWDETSKQTTLREVVKAYRNPAMNLRRIEVGGETIRTTDAHPFWVTGKGWVRAADIAVADTLRDQDGSLLTVAANEKVSAETYFAGYHEPATPPAVAYSTFAVQPVSLDAPGSDDEFVYNLEVGGSHTYFVGQHRILVHNY
ncbi:MAG TPA: polymorphic toxin-type HINT domain-containing protein [Candidatus Limnocylindrales bacterium]|nr:polymorphic toxin-type HINT domain-containing protein [Candidatus Limnocylindrales bacterium]